MFPLSIANYFEIGAFIAGAITWKKIKGTPLGLFPLFLFFIVFVELFGRYLIYELHYKQNTWLFNLSTPVEFIFYAYVFSLTLRDKRYKKAAGWFMIVFPLLVVLNILFVQGLMHFNSYTMVLGSICMISFCCLFYYELLLDPVEEQLVKDPMFWITTGILFYNIGDLAFNLLFDLLMRYNGRVIRNLFLNINNNLTLILYSCFILAFLCKRNLRRSLSQ